MVFYGLSKKEEIALQYEVIPKPTRLKLTRLIRSAVKSDDQDREIENQNKLLNIANNVLGLPIYVLESDGWGMYHPAENAYHMGEMELLMLKPNTRQLIEIIADYVENDILPIKEINEILVEGNCSVQYQKGNNDKLTIKIAAAQGIEGADMSAEHPNIRQLVERMDRELKDDDYTAVLHSSASIFETLAKDVLNDEAINEKSLGSFFEKYRNESKLPGPILDHILAIFNQRSTEPLAGHGNTKLPSVKKEQAIILSEMTKAFVRIEREFQLISVKMDKETNKKVKAD
ncbi:MAG: hypothetical protein WC632_03565 [Candidatus Margulisiibacteriota bacterium]